MTAESGAPRVFNIVPGAPFADALAAGLLDMAGGDPLALMDMRVLLPTRRACRTLREAFLRQSKGAPTALPRLTPLGDVDEDELTIADWDSAGLGGADGIPPALGGMRRQIMLAKAIRARDPETGPDQAVRLALELARLLDQVHTERLSFDGLKSLAPLEMAGHWEVTLEFLRILTENWPDILAVEGAIDPADRRNRLLEGLARHWSDRPPSSPVIAAGSTGSIPATADLLEVVAGLPEGRVVLPGLDRDLPDDAWRGLQPSHPQYGLMRLLDRLAVDRTEVDDWPLHVPAAAERAQLVNAALAPAGYEALADEFDADAARVALNGVERVICATPREEATVIALAMRRALETPGRTAALVTPDRSLARRVAAELRRWDLEIDDSAGRPLGEMPPGTYLRLVAEAVAEGLAPASLLAMLKHPLAAGGMAPAEFRALARRLEIACVRGPRPSPGLDGMERARANAEILEPAERYREQRAAAVEARSITPILEAALSEFQALFDAPAVDLGRIIRCHVAAAEALAASDDMPGPARLWRGEAGDEAAAFMSELMEAGGGWEIAPAAYPALFEALMTGRAVRPAHGDHPRLFIWGLLEARLQRADLTILGGLNEETWPPEAKASPWMSRPMTAAFGLPAPERRIGLTAHDFVQALAAPEVLITRSERVDGTPTVPSRWLMRIDNLLQRTGATDCLKPADYWTRWVRGLDKPDAPRLAKAPAPKPPAADRPKRLSATRIETLIRDPYAIYAEHVLRLSPLDPIDADPGAAERGSFIHDALDRFVRDHPDALPDDAERRLIELGHDVFADYMDRPGVRAFWWPRFKRIARWFVDNEQDRRAAGFMPAKTEARGELRVNDLADGFTVTAVADRIDLRPDIGDVVIDYKTGPPPSAKQVETMFAPQLPIEAAILAEGGFEGVPAGDTAQLLYVKLSGGRDPGLEKHLDLDVRDVVRATREGLVRLVQRFADPSTPYRSQPRPLYMNPYGDYDHLARVKEWRSGRARK